MSRQRRTFSTSERAEIWHRWRKGERVADIARALTRTPPAVHYVVKSTGGFAPRPRKRSVRWLSAAEREEISRGLSLGLSLRAIARQLERPASTISREVARNRGRTRYRATTADERALEQARRPKLCKLAVAPQLRRCVADKLARCWSPEQISGWLKRHHPVDMTMQVSHEAIYRSLFVQARGVLRTELVACLRSQRDIRQPRRGGQPERRGTIPDAVSIRERPASVEDRAVPGHWEGDLLAGTQKSYVGTLVERKSRFTMLVKVPSKETSPVIDALIKQARKLPDELRRSLTWDRGHEMAGHKRFTLATDIKVYFCDPQSPWQRGSNENTNGLLRQYFPKGKDVSQYSQSQLNSIARELNERPRKTLGFRTPAEVYNLALQ